MGWKNVVNSSRPKSDGSHIFIGFVCFLLVFMACSVGKAEDWATYQHDNKRSGTTSEQLRLPLELVWAYQTRHAPQPAWPEPAKHDYHWRRNYNLKPIVTFDRAFQMVVAGGHLYFGSSADDKVYCLDASTGAERWSFFTEGPVRLAPTVANSRVYVGSDDGWAYCLDAENGTLLWRYKPSPQEHRIPGNERMISLWPVRSGVLIHNDLAVFCAGLFPTQGVYFASLDAKDGTERNKEQIEISSQGYLMMKQDKLFTPTGRTRPLPVSADGFSKNLLTKPRAYPYSSIRTGNVTFTGGENKVIASRAGNKKLWTAEVAGKAYGLAAADGKLFVSTDRGMIYCFGKKTAVKARIISPANNPSPYPENNLTAVYARTAKQITEQTGIRKGYCLVLGCGRGQLAYELARLTDLKIIGVEQDAEKVAAARNALDGAGLYGRVVVHHGSPNKLPYGKYLFNLIVSDRTIATGKLPGTAGEVFRLLRPCGGTAYIGQPEGINNKSFRPELQRWIKGTPPDRWKIKQDNGLWLTATRGRLPGSGQWSHQYADAGNSSYSGEKLIRRSMQLQWFGRPGAHDMLCRHSRPHAPLSTNGRLFILGDQHLYGLDAYNGTILWELESPELQTRVNLPRDSGYMAADDDYLYLAVKDKCWRIDAGTGKLAFSYDIAQPKRIPVKEVFDWGYLACEDDLIFGSGVRKGTFYADAKGPHYDGSKPLFSLENSKVCSDYLFAVGKVDGKVKWRYDGLIINSAIAVGGNRVYFVENRNSTANTRWFFLRRLAIKELWRDLYLVALDTGTGEKVWEKPADFVEGNIVFYLSYSDETILVVSSLYATSCYTLYAFNAPDGSLLWQKKSGYRKRKANSYDHSDHMQHPVIMEGVIYQDPHDFNLKAGVQGALVLSRWITVQGSKVFTRGGCDILSAAQGYLFGRGYGGNPCMFDLSKNGECVRITHVSRPGCWTNIIPAGGLVLIPEASSGCSCPYPVQTSMAFVSQNVSDPGAEE